MAVTAQAHRALPLEPSAWTVRPARPRRRQGWLWAAAGLGGAVILVAAVVAVTITLGRNSASGSTTRTGETGSPSAGLLSALGREYASLVRTYTNAERSWKARAATIVPRSTSSAEALIRPTVQFADTVDRVQRDLAHLSWPASLRGDADALEADLATVSGDLRSIGGQTVSSMAPWESNVVADTAQSGASSDRLLRHLAGMTEVRP